jgi:hypothetical protein
VEAPPSQSRQNVICKRTRAQWTRKWKSEIFAVREDIKKKNMVSFCKKNRKEKELIVLKKTLLSFCIFLVSLSSVNAQKGLFVKLSVGQGVTTEYSNINNTCYSLVTKNHAIGWGITDRFAVQVGEFGGLNKQKINDYSYINLDAFGLGFSYRTPINIKISALGAYSKVSFAKKWSEATGDDGGKGLGINLSIDKEWFVAKRWGIRVGPQLFWLKTTDTDYKFFNLSINGSVVFYLKPVQ